MVKMDSKHTTVRCNLSVIQTCCQQITVHIQMIASDVISKVYSRQVGQFVSVKPISMKKVGLVYPLLLSVVAGP